MNIIPNELVIEIFNYLDLENLIKMEQVCQIFKLIVRSNPWHQQIKLQDKTLIEYIFQNYQFQNYDLSESDINDNQLNLLPKCKTINLTGCDLISDDAIKRLIHCHQINLTGCDTNDDIIKYLEDHKCTVTISNTPRKIKYFTLIIDKKPHSRFIGYSARHAVYEAFNYYLDNKKCDPYNTDEHIIEIKETTRRSSRKKYKFKCRREKCEPHEYIFPDRYALHPSNQILMMKKICTYVNRITKI